MLAIVGEAMWEKMSCKLLVYIPPMETVLDP
jgi:hypothetical protein